MKLWDVMDMDLYRQMLLEKYVRINKHPNLPISILNYTEKAQFENVWNEVTKQCRGLIIDSRFNIVARPFDKFLNYGQNQADIFLKDYPVQVTDKMDGSLGIVFYYDANWHVATRGSFTSDQAIWATQKYRDMRARNRDIDPWIYEEIDWTILVEIIYPANRIVIDYRDREELVLLGARNCETGVVLAAKDVPWWRGTKTTTFPYKTLTEALEAPPRPNAEGYVVYFPDLDYRVKIKQDDYIALHKIVTGLTERRIWESMKEGKTLDDLCSIVPDEWHDWLRTTYGDLLAAYSIQTDIIRDEYEDLSYGLMGIYGMSWTRKDFALEAQKYQYTGFMFMILDHKDITDKVWDLVRPSAE